MWSWRRWLVSHWFRIEIIQLELPGLTKPLFTSTWQDEFAIFMVDQSMITLGKTCKAKLPISWWWSCPWGCWWSVDNPLSISSSLHLVFQIMGLQHSPVCNLKYYWTEDPLEEQGRPISIKIREYKCKNNSSFYSRINMLILNKQLEKTVTVSMLETMETRFHLRKWGDEGIS